MPFGSVSKSLEAIYKHVRLRRFFREESGVKSCFWFAKDPDSHLHISSGVVQVLITIVLAPLYIVYPHNKVASAKKYLKQMGWFVEYSNIPHSILHVSPMGGTGKHLTTGLNPRWLPRVDFDDQDEFNFVQIPWAEKPFAVTDSAIGYAMSSARVLFDEAKLELLDLHPAAGRMYSLRDRKRISQMDGSAGIFVSETEV